MKKLFTLLLALATLAAVITSCKKVESKPVVLPANAYKIVGSELFNVYEYTKDGRTYHVAASNNGVSIVQVK